MRTFYEIDKEVSEAVDREYRNIVIAVGVLVVSILVLTAIPFI